MEVTERVTLPQIVAERIKQYIVENQLEAGARLPTEKQLIETLQVSRTVVREALKNLEVLGILRIKVGGGVFVETPSLKPVMDQVSFLWKHNQEKMEELLETRRILELGAVELAIKHRDLALIDQMEIWNGRMEQAIHAGKLPIEEDLEFHRALFKAIGNQTYFVLSDVLSKFFHNTREMFFGDVKKTLVSFQQHKQLIELLREGNLEAAKHVMLEHLAPLEKLARKST